MLDTLGLRDAALRAPETLLAAAGLARELPGEQLPSRVGRVLLLGAGEGAVASRLVAAVASRVSPAPVLRCTGPEVPACLDDATLVLALAWSDAAETVEACRVGVPAAAPLVVVGGGEQLSAAGLGREVRHVEVPAGVPAGRAGVGALAAAGVVLLETAGLFPDASARLERAAAQLERRRDEASEGRAATDRLARRVAGTFPLVQGAGPLGAAAATSLVSRVRLDAKSPAFWSAMPDLVHDELSGWGQHGDVTRQILSVLQLRHDHEPTALADGFARVNRMIDEVVVGIHELHAAGDGPLAQVLDLCLQGDLLALALAAEAGLDPGQMGVDG